jgi:glycerate 2-kinase
MTAGAQKSTGRGAGRVAASEVATRWRDDALAIWRAGVAAVDSERLVKGCLRATDQALEIRGQRFPLSPAGRILVVGAGKAGAGMAAGLEAALAGTPCFNRLSGWVNVPSDCVRPLRKIHLHPARPAGLNEPTVAGVAGAEEILRRVHQLSTEDLCLVLLSGGASALLPAPAPGVSLADKLAVTRLLMAGGATINELNCVRKHLSAIKGGNLARAAGEARVVSLIISDVIGDPLDVIGSGPTVADRSTVADALGVLERIASRRSDVPDGVWSFLEAKRNEPPDPPLPIRVCNFVIGNNETALSAAASKASELGYVVRSLGSGNRGEAPDVGRELAARVVAIRDADAAASGPYCLLAGGETTVRLAATSEPRRGGRNQELVLGVVDSLWADGLPRVAVLSGGTDGEDGPTDAAGAVADAELIQTARQLGLSPGPFLAINNAYEFFDRTGGLIKTGPTHTNVMDVWVALIARPSGFPPP